jgi:hypothetical protein
MMNEAARDRLDDAREISGGAIRRRHVIYLSGYDPRGVQGYYELFRRTCDRFTRLWPASLTLQPLHIESDEVAYWDLALRGANWQVATRYEFVRMESFIRADMDGPPTARQALRALGWLGGDLISGAQFRIFRASWRFAVHLWWFQLLALGWVAAAAAVGGGAGAAASHFGLPTAASIIIGGAAALAALLALRPLAQRWRLVQISACWATLRRFGRGRPTWLDQVVERGARRVIAAARANDADEVAVIGHSTGGVTASAIMARALELEPGLGGSGPRLVLLTLGSVMPAVALHPAARRMRDIVGRLATAQNLAWVDCQSRKDVMCFANFDPVAGIGLDAGPSARNPLLWRISFKDMIAPEQYKRFRWNHFRVHYQYILPGDRPAPYDYILLVGGPASIAEWPERDRALAATLMADAAGGERRHHEAMAGTAS